MMMIMIMMMKMMMMMMTIMIMMMIILVIMMTMMMMMMIVMFMIMMMMMIRTGLRSTCTATPWFTGRVTPGAWRCLGAGPRGSTTRSSGGSPWTRRRTRIPMTPTTARCSPSLSQFISLFPI